VGRNTYEVSALAVDQVRKLQLVPVWIGKITSH